MKVIKAVVLLLMILLVPFKGAAAEGKQIFSPVEKEYICAWLSLAAYDDRIGLAAREELALSGWEMAKHQEETKKSAPEFFLVKRTQENGAPVYLVALTGTNDKKDIKTDINFSKVRFGGNTKEEFIIYAGRVNVKSDEPQVHGGFNNYTQTAFFTKAQEDGLTLGEWLAKQLKEDTNARLYLTGHSLGGAAAVLLAERLHSMGVARDQVEVVTFGAPAVGNAAFCELCKDMDHDRIVIDGDPVRGVLQSLNAGYAVSGNLNVWKSNPNADLFKHSMAVYLDAAMRRYYDEYPDFPQGADTAEDVYVAVRVNIASALESDKYYIEQAIKNYLYRTSKGAVIFSKAPQATKRDHLNAAKKADCEFVEIIDVNVQSLKSGQTDRSYAAKDAVYDNVRGHNVYTIAMQEAIYDSLGNLIGGFGATTNNKAMTPIEAAVYDAVFARADRARLLGW